MKIARKGNDESWGDYLSRASLFDRKTGCWNWQKCVSHGYGIVRYDGKNIHAHRLSYMMFVDSAIGDLQVNHHCDNRQCINPWHLYAGTQKENVHDMHERGGFNLASIQGENNPHAKLTEADVRTIKARLQSGESAWQIAKSFPVNERVVRRIRDGEKWKHIT